MSPSLRSRLALAAVKKRLPELVAADPVAKLADGLHVAIVGSGSPLPDAKRGNPCAAVIAGGRVYVVDAGERSSETLNRMQIAPNRIEAVLLTHFHSDHIGGLASVNLQRWVADAAPTPMRVLGPPGVERVVGGLNEAYALDRGYRPPTTVRRWPRPRAAPWSSSRMRSRRARRRWPCSRPTA